MMKKGFTLAEVLITLAIIGVVATMVLPGILTSTTEQQAKTAIKKAVNVLTNIAKMNEAIDGYDFATTNSTGTGDDEQSIYSMIIRRADVDQQKISDYEGGDLIVNDNAGTALAPASNHVIFFRDGSFVSFEATETGVLAAQDPQNGIRVLYDMNGTKAPNMLSNCHAPGSQVSQDNDNKGDCTPKANRFIKDRFSLLLRGSQVIPNGDAARWLYNN